MKKMLILIGIIALTTYFFIGCYSGSTTTAPDNTTVPPAQIEPAEETQTPASPPAVDEHEDEEDEHSGELAPEEIHEFLNEALAAIKRTGDASAAILEMESARAAVNDGEVIEQINHIIEELEAGDLAGAVHELEDWLGDDEHEDEDDEHSGELAPEEIHEFLEAAIDAVKGGGDMALAIHELEEAREVVNDEEVIEQINHLIEEIEGGEMEEVIHELEDWLGADTH